MQQTMDAYIPLRVTVAGMIHQDKEAAWMQTCVIVLGKTGVIIGNVF